MANASSRQLPVEASVWRSEEIRLADVGQPASIGP